VPYLTASPNPVPIDKPTIISPPHLHQEPLAITAPALLDDQCFLAAEPSFSKRLWQNEIIFQATLEASQQRFEHTLQLSHMAFEAQMEHL